MPETRSIDNKALLKIDFFFLCDTLAALKASKSRPGSRWQFLPFG